MGLKELLEDAIYGPSMPEQHSCMKHKPNHHDQWRCPECGQEWSFDSGGPGQCWRPVEPDDSSKIYYAAKIKWPQS